MRRNILNWLLDQKKDIIMLYPLNIHMLYVKYILVKLEKNILKIKKDISGKSGEINIKSIASLIVFHQC